MTDTALQNIPLERWVEYLMQERRMYLTRLDALEALLGISPRTSELRKMTKEKQTEPPQTPPNVVK